MKSRGVCFAMTTWLLVAFVSLAHQPVSAGEESTEADVRLFLKQHCYRCHGAETHEADFAMHHLKFDVAGGQALGRWTQIAARLKAGDMPPTDEPQPDPDNIDRVVAWIEGQLTLAGQSKAINAGDLHTGNHVDHDLLFNSQVDVPLYAPSRIWRLNNQIYRNLADGATDRALTRTDARRRVTEPFSIPPSPDFQYRADIGLMDESTAMQLIRNAEQLVLEQTRKAVEKTKGARKTPAEFEPLFVEDPPATDVQVKAAVAKQFELWLKRQPTEDELTDYLALHRRNLKSGGLIVGSRATLMAVLLHPESVFRFEVGEPETDGNLRRLSPRETAFAIAYALTDTPPSEGLLKLADNGQLTQPDDIAAEVRRMLAAPKPDKPRIQRFFREYFGYATAPDVFKEAAEFPAFKVQSLVNDTDLLVKHILQKDRDVLQELLTTNLSFTHFSLSADAKKRYEKEIASFKAKLKKDPRKYEGQSPKIEKHVVYENYNLPDFVPPEDQPVRLPPKQRAGILTQPSWLVAWSGNFDNDPVKRGKWIRTRLLGGTVPDLPIGVDAQLPDEPHNTLRERMRVTRDTYCWQCHRKMNPLGITFENFDHFGRFRTHETVLDPEATEKNVDSQGRPKGKIMRDIAVDARGAVDYTGDTTLDGDVHDSIELIHRLARSDRVRQVFVRHAFRYWMGREENLGDARTLRAADKAYVESGGSMNALIVSLLSSESFLYRTTPDTKVSTTRDSGGNVAAGNGQ